MSYKKLQGDETKAKRVRFTSSGGDSAGDVVLKGTRVGVVRHDVADTEDGILYVATDEKGILMPKATGAISAGAVVYWDADGDPVGGTSGTGAVTTTSTDNTLIGYAAEAALSGDAEVAVELVEPQG